MNPALDATQFQAQLGQFGTLSRHHPWSALIIAAALLLLGMLAVLALHWFLRARNAKPGAEEPSHPLYLYKVPVRIWHWLNASLFLALIGSGFVNHFALAPAKLTVWLVDFHFVCGLALAAAWVAFVIINIATGNGRHYVLHFAGLASRMVIQAKYYLGGIIRGEPHPFHADEKSKFNPMQQIAYIGVVYALIPFLIMTGLFAYNPEWLGSFAHLRHWVFMAHLLLAIASLFFLFGHLYLCTTGRTPTETFKAMIDGYHR